MVDLRSFYRERLIVQIHAVEAADKNLYIAKSSGRNRVHRIIKEV